MMKKNVRGGGIHSRLVAVTVAAAMLVASVATGTAVAAEDVPEETQPQIAAQTLDTVQNDGATSDDAVEGGTVADGTGATGDAVGSGDQTDAAAQHGDDADAAGDVAGNDASEGDASDSDTADVDDNVGDSSDGDGVGGEDVDKQTAVDEDAVADDGDAANDSAGTAASNADTGASPRVLADHTVSGVSPRGTTINLFDYDGAEGGGKINNGHVFHFASGGQSSYTKPLTSTTVNEWTGNYQYGNLKPAPRFGIVQNKLDADGYPVLSNDVDGTSLDYLFNDEDVSGKTSYAGVNGLLQVDDDGYYYYNSQQNFAQFNPDSDSFTLYDTWGVNPVGNSPAGQFFPFNTGAQVFDEQNGNLVQKNMNSRSGNHYFGLTMSTRFVQQYNGHVDQEEKKPVTYNFSGDDDVWVYIDGVLVGDLGGIHDQVSLQIDFSTGDVVIYTDGRVGNNQSDNKFDAETAVEGEKLADGQAVQKEITSGKDVYWKKTTLKKLFRKAGVDVSSWGNNSNTLPDNTYHKLDFFYMERGAADSNMALRYNLVSIPNSGIAKIDQDGNPMSNVEFTLQQANKQTNGDYQLAENGITVKGTTGDKGELILTHASVGNADGTPYTLDELGDASRYWILTENDTPEGYRGVQPVHLYFAYGQTGNENLGTGPLLVDNKWYTGAYSAAHVTVQADATVHGTTTGENYDLDEGGTLFAVVMKKVDGTWHPVSGDAFTGWKVHNSGNTQQDIIAAAQKNPYIFTPGTNGSYETTIEDLPGDILTYRHMIQEYEGKTYDKAMAAAEYSVAYFYTTGDLSAHAGPEHAVTSDNTAQISSEGGADSQAFDRIFSVTLNVPNIKNELSLEKTDATTGKRMSGVEFKLYNADGNGDPTGHALNTLTTGEDGTLQVYTNTSNKILAKGNYVLVETAPDGYVDEQTSIPVVVDDSGVYADAGATDDNVTVETGLGTLVYSMKGFAAGDQIDATLHDVKAQPQKADTYNGASTEWTSDGDKLLHLQYVDNNNRTLNYQGWKDSATTHTATAGWSTLTVQQCRDHESDNNALVKQDLKKTDLSALFTGDVTIHVTNKLKQSKGSFVIQKELAGRDWQDDDSFSFSVMPAKNDDTNVDDSGKTSTSDATQGDNPAVELPDGMSLTIESDTETKYGKDTIPHAVTYGDIVFKQAGTYTFTVSEQRGGDANLNYSDATFTVKFEVTDDNLNGKGSPEVSILMSPDNAEDGDVLKNGDVQYGVKFINSLMKVSSLPLTGDDMTARNLLLVGGGVLLLAGAAWLLARRRRV